MKVVARTLQVLKTSPFVAVQKRQIHPRFGHIIPLPPSVKIPFAEKLALGSVVILGLLSIPSWVLYNLEYYKTGGARTEPSKTATRELDMRTETVLELADQNEVAEGRK